MRNLCGPLCYKPSESVRKLLSKTTGAAQACGKRRVGLLLPIVLASLWAGLTGNAQAPPAEEPPQIPKVLLTDRHQKLCRVKVGDPLPAAQLPSTGGAPVALKTLYGKRGTVVLLWERPDWMTRAALIDLSKSIPRQFAPQIVSLVGIAVQQNPESVQQTLQQTGAAFPQLLDFEGKIAAQITGAVLPQVFVLDAKGRVAWFDIEYSEAARRELRQSLAALMAQ